MSRAELLTALNARLSVIQAEEAVRVDFFAFKAQILVQLRDLELKARCQRVKNAAEFWNLKDRVMADLEMS